MGKPDGLPADFHRLFAGQIISQIGSRITREGLPITAITMLGIAPSQMGLLVSVAGFAMWLGAPLSGYLADRMRRRPILIACDILAALTIAVVPVAAFTGHLTLPLLAVVLVFAGLTAAAFDVATQTYVPSLVPIAALTTANSRLALSNSLAEMTGPALAGLLIQTLTAPRAMLLDSVSFLISALLILSIRRKESPARAHHAATPGPAIGKTDILAGLRAVFTNPILRAIVLRDAIVFFFYGFFGALVMMFALRDLRIQPAALGLVIAVGGVSNFFGASLAQGIGRRIGPGPAMIAATLMSSAGLLFLPLATGPASGILFMALSQAMDFCFPLYEIHSLTLRQSIAEPSQLGRINAAMQTLGRGVWPFGAIIGGLLATGVGIRVTLAIAGLGVLSAGLFLLASPIRGIRSMPVSRTEPA